MRGHASGFVLAAALAALLPAGPADAQDWDSGRRIFAVRSPAVLAAPDPLAPAESARDFGSPLAEPKYYQQVDHPLYSLYLRRLEQVGLWDLDPLEAPDGLNTGNFLAFLRNAKEKYGYKLQALAEKPDKSFRFKGELIRAGSLGKALKASYVIDPHWTTGYSAGSVGVKLVSKIYDTRAGTKIAEQAEASTVSVQLAGLVESMTEIETQDFIAKLDYRGRKELRLGAEIFPAGSAQIQYAIGRQALIEADSLARRAVSKARDVEAMKARGTITEVPGDQIRTSLGLVADANVDSVYWILRSQTEGNRKTEERIGFAKVRDVQKDSSLAQPIAEGQPFSTGDAALLQPMAGVTISPRALVNALAFLPLNLPDTYNSVASSSALDAASSFPVPFVASLPIELDLGPLFRSGALSETSVVLEPMFGLRRTAQDVGGTLGARKKFYLHQLALTAGLKAGATYSTLKLGTTASESAVIDPEGVNPPETIPEGTPLTATQIGISAGPEFALDFQFHPNFSAGLFLDFMYTFGLAPTVRAAEVESKLDLAEFWRVDGETGDLLPAQVGAVPTLRLGAGLHATLTF